MKHARVIRLYQRGLSAMKIAAKEGVSGPTIIRWLKRAGVARRSAGARQSKLISARRARRIVELYGRGLTYSQIGRRFSIRPTMVLWSLRKSGAEIRAKRITPEMSNEIMRLYGLGVSSLKIALHFSLHPTSVRAHLQKMGVARRHGADIKIGVTIPTTESVTVQDSSAQATNLGGKGNERVD